MLNKKQITSDFALFDKVAKVQSSFTERKKNSRTIQDSILDGGVINISKVLVVEENGQKTYTFPLTRTFQSTKIENLVIKRNIDSTFSGALVQYDLTPLEKDLFSKWHSIDLKSKTKIFDIRNLVINTSARVVTTRIGCFILDYEDGTCASTDHHTNPADCQLTGSQAPQLPRILSITAIPGCGGGGGNNSGSDYDWGTSSPPIDGGFSSNGGDTNTMPFDNYDLTYYNSDDMTDPAFQFWSQVSQFMQKQPDNVKQLNSLNQYFFYFTHNYFSTYGINPNTKAIISERLQFIANWYFDYTNSNGFDTSEKLYYALQAEKYALEDNIPLNELVDILGDWSNPDIVKPTIRLKKNARINCIYNKAKTSPNFKQYLQNFDGRFSTAHLLLDLKPLQNSNANAQTSPPNGYWITITINSNNLDRPSLDIARTFMHEMIHAEMFRILLSLAPTSNGQIDVNELINMLNNQNYPGIYDYFRRFGMNNMQHEQMAAHYRGILKNFLKQIDSSITDSQAESMAWVGLQGTVAWSNLGITNQTNILNTYNNWKANASQNCP